MTTIHAYTGDQMLLDGPHKDLRRARSAAVSIVRPAPARPRTAGLVIPDWPAGWTASPSGSPSRMARSPT